MTHIDSPPGRRLRRGYRAQACFITMVCVLLAVVTDFAGVGPADDKESDGKQDIVLGVAHLNADCYRDTVVGWADLDGELRYIPRFILWGRPSVSDSLGLGDSACTDNIPRKKKYHRTPIKLPNWRSMKTSVAFERINGDTLTDLVIHVRGDEEKQGKLKKMRRSLVLFGQRGTDTLSTLDFEKMEKFQSRPFFGMELRRGVDLTEPARRDLSGRTSWILLQPEIDMPEAPAPPAASVEIPAPPHSVNIYPNPAGTSVTVEMAGLAHGEHLLELVAVNGQLEQRREVAVGEAGAIAETLDLGRAPSGYYVVRMLRGGVVVGTYGVVVKK